MSTGIRPSFSMSGLPICCRHNAGHNRPEGMASNLIMYHRSVDNRLLPIIARPGKRCFPRLIEVSSSKIIRMKCQVSAGIRTDAIDLISITCCDE